MEFLYLILIPILILILIRIGIVIYRQIRLILSVILLSLRHGGSFRPARRFWWWGSLRSDSPDFFVIRPDVIYSVKLFSFWTPPHPKAILFESDGRFGAANPAGPANRTARLSFRSLTMEFRPMGRLNRINFRKTLPVTALGTRVIPVLLFYHAPERIYSRTERGIAPVPDGSMVDSCVICRYQTFCSVIRGDFHVG